MRRDAPSAEWLTEHIAAAIAPEIGAELPQVGRLASAVLDGLRARFGGAYLYIPSQKSGRQAVIMAEFNGRNVAELAEKHGVSERWVRRLTAPRKPPAKK